MHIIINNPLQKGKFLASQTKQVRNYLWIIQTFFSAHTFMWMHILSLTEITNLKWLPKKEKSQDDQE